jgi:ubiquinone/menaquinone biosynthesis C-methylase UbiE
MPLASFLYDACVHPQELLGVWKLRARTVGPAEGRVLEVGVGTGLNLRHYRKARELVGIDPDPILLRRARKRARRVAFPVRLELGDTQTLAFPDASFDTVVATFVFCTVPDAPRGLRELRRVVRPGGSIRMLEHVRSLRPWVAKVQDWVEPVWVRVLAGCHPNRDTVRMVREAGIEVTGLRRYRAMVSLEGRVAR